MGPMLVTPKDGVNVRLSMTNCFGGCCAGQYFWSMDLSLPSRHWWLQALAGVYENCIAYIITLIAFEKRNRVWKSQAKSYYTIVTYSNYSITKLIPSAIGIPTTTLHPHRPTKGVPGCGPQGFIGILMLPAVLFSSEFIFMALIGMGMDTHVPSNNYQDRSDLTLANLKGLLK